MDRIVNIRLKVGLFLLFVLLFCGHAGVGYARAEDKTDILMINSYHSDNSYVYGNIHAFINEYTALKGQANFIVENMNCTSLTKASSWKSVMDEILNKHPNPSVILLFGAEAWHTYLSLPDDKYKEIPLICSMSYRYGVDLLADGKYEMVDFLERMKPYNVLACYTYEYQIDENIKLAKQLYPALKNIALLTDNTYNGISHLAIFQDWMNKHPEYTPVVIDGRKEDMDSALKLVGGLPENSAMLLGVWRIDKDDAVYLNNAVYAMSSANPSLPVFSFTGTGIGNWALGGTVPKHKNIGNEIGVLIHRFLDKKEQVEPYVETAQTNYLFDVPTLERFGVNQKILPKEAEFINEKQTFWTQYKWVFIITVCIIVLLLIGFIGMSYHNIRVRKLMKELEQSEQKLRKEKELLEHSEKKLRLAKEEAEEANRMKSLFVSNMSHEIRTPLNAIVGFSNIIVSMSEENEEQAQYIEIINRNNDLLLQLVNDILDLSNLEAGGAELRYSCFDIVPFLRNTIQTVIQTKHPSISISLHVEKDATFLLETDMMRLEQIIMNLLNNAIKFTPEGSVTISYDIDNSKQVVLFKVADTGIGIPADKATIIFERFEKLDTFAQGTGLGLSICKMLVQKLEGEIWVDTAYRQGALFIFSIPFSPLRNK